MSATDAILAILCILLFVAIFTLPGYCYSLWERDADRSVQPSVMRDQVGDGDEHDRGRGLSEATILSYPMLQYSLAAENTDANDDSNNSCSICLSSYQEMDIVRVLPECMHFFHSKCIDPWLKLHSTCPICRKQLM